MNELVLRVLIVGVILFGVGAVALAQRHPRRSTRRIDLSLEPGVYLFSSRSCLECDPARAWLRERLGPDGFLEVAWESDRELFEESGIDAVPTTMFVAGDGGVTLVEGVPGPMLDSFSP